jgi:hypothetical protein
MAPGLAVYTLRLTVEALSAAGASAPALGLALEPGALDAVERMLVAAAPLVTLPASVMHRPWSPSLLPGLAALAGAYLALKAPLAV